MQRAIVYQADAQTRHADTCEALVRGSEAGEVELVALARGAYPGARLGRNVLPGVRSVGFWDAAHDQSWGLDWHMNEGLELTFLETGHLAFATGERHYVLGAEDLTITRPWQPHRVGAPDVTASRLHWLILDVGVRRPNEPWKWPGWIILTAEDRAELTTILRHNEQPVWHTGPDLRRCVQRIAQSVVQARAGGSVTRLMVHLNELLITLLDLFRERQVDLDDRLTTTQRTVELFLNHLREDDAALAQPWTANQMAEHCGLGLTRFVHYCRQLTNMTPMNYLNTCRVESAARLLSEADLSITAVAMRCGFTSSQYFATVFKNYFGQTPRAYRAATSE